MIARPCPIAVMRGGVLGRLPPAPGLARPILRNAG
jgi:hypothetical protein